MTHRHNLPRYLALAILAGCSGAIVWEPSCGCPPAYVHLMDDLQIPANLLTPETIAERTKAKLVERGKPITLASVRDLGFTFDESCVAEGLKIRCTFWYWYSQSPRKEKGIELLMRHNVTESPEHANVSARYVFRES